MDTESIPQKHLDIILPIIEPHLKPDANRKRLGSYLTAMKGNVVANINMYNSELRNAKREKELLKQMLNALNKKRQQLIEHTQQTDFSYRTRPLLSPLLTKAESLEQDLDEFLNEDLLRLNHRGVKEDFPLNTFVQSLCRLWFEQTGMKPTQSLDIETPFKNFVYACFDALEDENIFLRKLTDDSIRDNVRQYLYVSHPS